MPSYRVTGLAAGLGGVLLLFWHLSGLAEAGRKRMVDSRAAAIAIARSWQGRGATWKAARFRDATLTRLELCERHVLDQGDCFLVPFVIRDRAGRPLSHRWITVDSAAGVVYRGPCVCAAGPPAGCGPAAR